MKIYKTITILKGSEGHYALIAAVILKIKYLPSINLSFLNKSKKFQLIRIIKSVRKLINSNSAI